MKRIPTNSRVLFSVSALAALGFAALTVAVARGRTSRWDAAAKARLQASTRRESPAKGLVEAASTPGSWWALLPASLTVAGRLLMSGRRPAALAVTSASVGAALLSPALERVLPRRAPPPEHPDASNPSKQSYPSGHALQTSAAALTTGYVLWCERMAPKWSPVPMGLSSLGTVAGKLVLSRHWTSDVIGGYLAGIAWGSACAGAYALRR